MSQLPGKAHKPELDNLTPAQQRVVLEELLYTMQIEQRTSLMETFPGLYLMIFPDHGPSVVKAFQERLETQSDP